MPKLDQIMTRGGDKGQTSLVDGSRVTKSSPRVNTYGTVDELNSVFGLVRCEQLPDGLNEKVLQIQNLLFDLGCELATPAESTMGAALPKMHQAQVETLEQWLEEARQQLEPAENFVLPGGTRAAAIFHLARTVTRRCERQMVVLMENEPINPCCLGFVNRLSDLCFVWARLSNNQGRDDIFWQPAGSRRPAD